MICLNNKKESWERKYPIMSILNTTRLLIDIHPDLGDKLQTYGRKIGAPNYTEMINFLLEFYIEVQNERREAKQDP